MTHTLYQALYDLADLLDDLYPGVVSTAASASSITDDGTIETQSLDLTGGTLFMTSGSQANSARPVNIFSLASHVVTLQTALGGTPATNDTMEMVGPNFPYDVLVSSINKGLRRIGPVPSSDTSLTTVTHQEAYSLPSAVYGIVWLEIATQTSTPYHYKPHFNWYEMNKYIYFDEGCEPALSDYKIRLWYQRTGIVDELSGDSNEINDYIHRDRLMWEAAVHALRWKNEKYKSQDKHTMNRLEEAMIMREIMREDHPIPSFPARPHYARY